MLTCMRDTIVATRWYMLCWCIVWCAVLVGGGSVMESNTIGKFDCFGDQGTLGPRWRRWLSAFQLYADGKGLIANESVTSETKQWRRALMLHLADVQQIFETLPSTGSADDFQKAIDALNTYFVPKTNVAYARHMFRRCVQNPDESVQQFATRLRQLWLWYWER